MTTARTCPTRAPGAKGRLHLVATALLLTLVCCGPRTGPTSGPVPPVTPPPAGGDPALQAAQPAPVAPFEEIAAEPAQPTLPARPEGPPCLDYKPASLEKEAGLVVAEVASKGIGALQETSCTAAMKNPPPCDLTTCEAWVRYLSYDALVLYQKFELDAALEEALQAVRTGRECGLTGQFMARAYVGLGYILVDARNEMVKASNAFRWAFLMQWDVDLPFPSPPPNVKMTFQAAKASMGTAELSCKK